VGAGRGLGLARDRVAGRVVVRHYTAMNRDEAQRCLEMGRSALKGGDLDKAMRMFEKSDRLFPSDEAKSYIQVTLDRKAKRAEAPPPPEEKPEGPKATPEQIAECARIMKIENYYEVLGVGKEATQDEIKKAYRKHALRLHPDKNVAPGASEAFKRLNKAFSCLSDADKRRKYDVTGSDEPHTPTYQSTHFEGDEWAEEIFRQFFGGNYGYDGRVYRRGYYPQQQHNQAAARGWPLVQLLPFLVLLFLSAANSFTYSDPPYSLQQTYRHQSQRYTSEKGVIYYVDSTFTKDYSIAEIHAIDEQVEAQYIYSLRMTCQMQTSKRNQFLYNAQRSYSERTARHYQDLAQKVDLSACRQLEKIEVM